MTESLLLQDEHYRQAIATVEQTLGKLRRCSPEEKEKLRHELVRMQEMLAKLTSGRLEIVVFGEISTGK